MRKINLILAILVAVLLLASVWTYRESVTRADRFESGQKFLQALDIDQIDSIQIRSLTGEDGTAGGEDTVTLRRGEGRFQIVEANGYPARNETVNGLLRDLLDASLARELGRGEAAARDAGLVPDAAQVSAASQPGEIRLVNAAGDTMVHFRWATLDGAGVALQRWIDGEAEPTVYQSEQNLDIATDVDTYLDKDILDVGAADLVRIEGPDFLFETPEVGGRLALADIPEGMREKDSETRKIESALSLLAFDEVYLANAPEVAGLHFEPRLKFWLDPQSGYQLLAAERDEQPFVQVRSFHTVDQITFSADEADEELQEKADLRLRLDELEDFNALHGSWVYAVDESMAERLQLRKADLVESAP